MRIVQVLFFLLLLLAPGRADTVRASDWFDFREARVRLLLLPVQPGDRTIKGGVEIRLMPGFKTYWRSPGDSGVPPHFDFSESVGAAEALVSFPFPSRFDDGAGGQAWGYRKDTIFPFSMTRVASTGLALKLKLDFAVCGTMCIPLNAQLELSAGANIVDGLFEPLQRAHALVPRVLSTTQLLEMIRVLSYQPGPNTRIVLDVRHEGSEKDFALFAEGRGYFEVAVAPAINNFIQVQINAQPAPGASGTIGSLRVTFGTKKLAFEGIIDLDGLNPKP
ncbi:Thiol:disulfide interchange protein DsbD, N-terminal domain containing protein [Rhabdaerophilaceae bacterium]